MTVRELLGIYLLENRMTKKKFADKCGLHVKTIRAFMSGRDVFSESFMKIIKGMNYQIHLKPKQINKEAA